MHLSIFISIWQDELGEDLKLKVTQLEANNVQLEAKVEEEEKILNFLLQTTELPVSVQMIRNRFQIIVKFNQS